MKKHAAAHDFDRVLDALGCSEHTISATLSLSVQDQVATLTETRLVEGGEATAVTEILAFRPEVRQLIGLTGPAGSGKDAAAQPLTSDLGYTRVAFADPVRKALLALNPRVCYEDRGLMPLLHYVNELGWDGAKQILHVRELLQRMGTEAGRDIHGQDCWLKIAREKINAADTPVVVTDVRFANEAELIRELGGTVVHVKRPGVGPVNGHSSDAGVDVQLGDRVLVNDGPLEAVSGKIKEIAILS